MNLQASVLSALTLSTSAADLVVTSWGIVPSSVNISALASTGFRPVSAVMGRGVGGEHVYQHMKLLPRAN